MFKDGPDIFISHIQDLIDINLARDEDVEFYKTM